jgi:hypothetical protein
MPPLIIPRLRKTARGLDKLESMGWTGGIAFASHWARIGIRVTDSAVLDRLTRHLPIGWKASTSPVVDFLYSLCIGYDRLGTGRRCDHRLYEGQKLMWRTGDLDQLFECLESALESSVALGARNKLFVHAGVVGWRGRAIVIPGRSRSGKTSLVEALVRAGATYYSDEFAVFDTRGRVHPFPRALSIRLEGDAQARRRCPVEELGGCAGTRPLPVGLVAVTRYRPGARWQPRVLSPGETVLALLANTALARARPQFALAIFRLVVSEAWGLEGKRGDAPEVVRSLLDGEWRPQPTHTVGEQRNNRTRPDERIAGPMPSSPDRQGWLQEWGKRSP